MNDSESRPQRSVTANGAIIGLLDDQLRDIESNLNADVIGIYGPMDLGTDDYVRTVVERRKSEAGTHPQLAVLLDTGGGYIEVVSRMVDTIRRHYETVSFYIPNAAYSAGTVLAMSGDSIHMDYYSRLGPIDPQVPSANGEMIPALGYLSRYEDLIKQAKSKEGLSIAEIQLLISGFDQARLYKYEQARELTVTLLIDWLCKYKFKDWKTTEGRGLPVTDKMRKNRAEAIARMLNKTDRWHAHGHGISADVLRDELKLRIDDFGAVADEIRQYHDLITDYQVQAGIFGVAHAIGHFAPYRLH